MPYVAGLLNWCNNPDRYHTDGSESKEVCTCKTKEKETGEKGENKVPSPSQSFVA